MFAGLVVTQRALKIPFPAGNYMFEVNNRNTRARFEIYSKLTIKTPIASFWCLYCEL